MSEGMQNGKWIEMFMNAGENYNVFAAPRKALEPLLQLTKVQQQQSLRMAQAWIDHAWKMGEASRSGDLKKMCDSSLEAQRDLMNTCQGVLKEQGTARYELLSTLIPLPSSFKSTDA